MGLSRDLPQPLTLTPVNPAPETPVAPQRAAAELDSPRVVQKVLPAHAPTSSNSATHWRVLLLLGAAVSLATGLASMTLGMWDQDPLQTPAANTLHRGAGIIPGAAPATQTPGARPSAAATPTADTPTPALAPVSTSDPQRKRTRVRSHAPNFVAQGAPPDALQIAYAALAAGQLEQAAQLYGERLQAHPEECDALLGLAYIAHRMGHRDEALAYYQRVLRQDPEQVVAHAGVLALNNKIDLAQAAGRARDRADRDPDSAATLAALGGILVRQGRLAEAALTFARAQRLEPANATYAYNLAVAQDRLHQVRAARGAYERAITLSTAAADAGAHGFARDTAQQRLEQLRTAAADQPRAPACAHDGTAACAITNVAER